jgi:hypothetical protein
VRRCAALRLSCTRYTICRSIASHKSSPGYCALVNVLQACVCVCVGLTMRYQVFERISSTKCCPHAFSIIVKRTINKRSICWLHVTTISRVAVLLCVVCTSCAVRTVPHTNCTYSRFQRGHLQLEHEALNELAKSSPVHTKHCRTYYTLTVPLATPGM